MIATERPTRSSDHRQRILDAMAEVLTQKSYGTATVADLASQARVSKRTFYEHFSNKEDCLLALCEDTSARIMALILAVYSDEKDWMQLVSDVTKAYLQAIQASPALMHVLYIELFAIGRRGLEMKHEIAQRFADFLCGQVDLMRSQGHALKALDRLTAIAVVAGINDLILQKLMDGENDSLMDLRSTAQSLVLAVTRP